MSYDVQLYRIETKEREEHKQDKEFFDHEENLEPFTAEQLQDLKERLVQYAYVENRQDQYGTHYKHAELGITVLLTKHGLYFQTSGDQEAIFEIGMTASEFTDSGEFAKYDPQAGGWEKV
ncbi:MAG: hypothetical protein J0I41_15440 [Filimonas sp.]|nr:hypothetical protein [Filimonas sp.]